MVAQDPSMNTDDILYVAKQDDMGQFIPLHHKRRCVVVKYRRGRFMYVVTGFSNIKDAEKRAADMNRLTKEATTHRV